MTLLAAAAAATIADLGTFLAMTARHGLEAEANPVVRELAAGGMAGPIAAKLLILVVLTTWDRAVGRLTRAVLASATFVGVAGAATNIGVLLG